MKLTIILRAEVESPEAAQNKVDQIKQALASFSDVEFSAQTNEKIEPVE